MLVFSPMFRKPVCLPPFFLIRVLRTLWKRLDFGIRKITVRRIQFLVLNTYLHSPLTYCFTKLYFFQTSTMTRKVLLGSEN